jgi:hypothetical protein
MGVYRACPKVWPDPKCNLRTIARVFQLVFMKGGGAHVPSSTSARGEYSRKVG